MNFAPVLAAPLLLILTGTSFTSSPAQAQVRPDFITRPPSHCWTVFPLKNYEGGLWFEVPSCPSGWTPRCARQSGRCVTQLGETANVCREWRCARAPLRMPDKRDGGRCEPPTCNPFPCGPFKCPTNPPDPPPFPFR
jgi:hypothetical protein